MTRMVPAQTPTGDPFEGVDQTGQLDGGGEPDEQMDVVVLAVELAQLHAEVVADLPHDGLAVRQDLVSEGSTPILGHEHQVGMAVPNSMPATANGVDFDHDTNYTGSVDTQVLKRCRKYPVTLTPSQEQALDAQADAARALWNLIHAYYTFHERSRRWPTWAEVDAAVRQGRTEIDWLGVLPAQAAQQVLRSYRQAWANRWGGTHDRPTWKSRRARRAVDVPQARDLHLTRVNRKWGTAKIPKVGTVGVRLHQPPPDRITGARLVREASGWFLVIRGEVVAPTPTPRPDTTLGIDRGVVHTLADSDGNFLDQPTSLTPGEARRLYRLQRRAARQRRTRPKGAPVSNRLRRTYAQIAVLKARQARRRYDFAHQATAALVDLGHSTYAIEDLRIAHMTRSARGTIENPGTGVRAKAGLNRAITDQGWHQIDRLPTYKAEQAGARVVRVRPHGTSQECHRCGSTAPGQRESQALFRCANTACGWVGNADHNAAINIRTRGQELASQDVEPIGVSRAVKRQPTEACLM